MLIAVALQNQGSGPPGAGSLGCNTLSLRHPIHVTFQWGEGPPKNDKGVPMILHRARPYKFEEDGEERMGSHCFCGIAMYDLYTPQDCPSLRLQALAEATRNYDPQAILEHLSAVETWHPSGIKVIRDW